MNRYALMRKESEVTTSDLITLMRWKFPKFSKAILSEVEHPQYYGCDFTPEAKRHFRQILGYTEPTRKDNCHISVWLGYREWELLKALQRRFGFGTYKEMICFLIEQEATKEA